MRFVLLFLLVLAGLAAPLAARAQAPARYELSGQVRDGRTQRPLAFASVFLANTTFGVTTDSAGSFRLPGVPAGHYELTASYLGYKLSAQPVDVRSPASFVLALQPEGVALTEVSVRPGKNRAVDLQRFLRQFLGISKWSQQCRLENPDDVVIVYDKKTQELTAVAPGALRVLNPALGYRITYHHVRLKAFYKEGRLEYVAAPVFEPLASADARQQQRWQENRRRAYLGSLPHFLRSVYADQVAQEGFVVRAVRRELDSPETRQQLTAAADSLLEVLTPAPNVLARVYRQPLPGSAFRRADPATGQVWLHPLTELQVTYPAEQPDVLYTTLTGKAQATTRVETAVAGSRSGPAQAVVSQSSALATPETSQLQLLGTQTEALIQANGYLRNPLSVRVDGYWGYEKAGEALPLDYVPDPVK